jgi:hypothetical protein
LGKPKEYSQKSGNVATAEVYSYTSAMMPWHKESAYKHLPSFIGGIFFHVGTLISLLLWIAFFFVSPLSVPFLWMMLIITVLTVSAISGYLLLIKRLIVKKLRNLSNWDDYLSNFLTTFFQIMTVSYFVLPQWFITIYYISAILLFLYIPVGKLRHVAYFFAARFQLGYFYGWRNVWPPSKKLKSSDGKNN